VPAGANSRARMFFSRGRFCTPRANGAVRDGDFSRTSGNSCLREGRYVSCSTTLEERDNVLRTRRSDSPDRDHPAADGTALIAHGRRNLCTPRVLVRCEERRQVLQPALRGGVQGRREARPLRLRSLGLHRLTDTVPPPADRLAQPGGFDFGRSRRPPTSRAASSRRVTPPGGTSAGWRRAGGRSRAACKGSRRAAASLPAARGRPGRRTRRRGCRRSSGR